MTDYLPKNYQEPKLPTNYLRAFEQGDTKVRIMSPMIRGWKFWVEGGINPTTNQEERGRMIYLPEEAKVDPHTKPKFFWGFVVYNYKYEMIQIMEIISTQIKEPLMGYFHDPQWGDPRGYDLVISREGVGLKTRYQVRPYPNSEISEAEHFNDTISQSGLAWQTQISLPGYAGDGYVSALPDTGQQFDATYATTSPELQYTINFATPGIYYVWLRGYGADGAGDSVILGLDDQPAAIVTGFSPRIWDWTNEHFSGAPFAVNVETPGLHTLHLWQREDGVRVDKILLTTDNSYTPLGEGPAESGIQ